MTIVDFPSQGTIGTSLIPKRFDIEIYQGDTFSFVIVFKDADENLINVTGWTILAQIKNMDGTPATTPAFGSSVGGSDGKVTITLSAAQTTALDADTYKYDVQVTAGSVVRTYVGGRLTITEDISE